MTARRIGIPLLFVVSGALTIGACKPKKTTDDPPPPATISSARETVPPAASFNATPSTQFADAAAVDGQTPYDTAKAYQANGQLWMARLHIEQLALGPNASKEDTELLLDICLAQPDMVCAEKCAKKLGRKLKLDGGAPAGSSSSAIANGEHKEPDTDVARARDLVLKSKLDDARKILEPKVLDGKASREEIRLLKTVCEKQGDRMCVALCASKLK